MENLISSILVGIVIGLIITVQFSLDMELQEVKTHINQLYAQQEADTGIGCSPQSNPPEEFDL